MNWTNRKFRGEQIRKQDLISILSTKPNQIEFVGLEKVRGKREKRREKIMTLPGQPAWFGLVDKNKICKEWTDVSKTSLTFIPRFGGKSRLKLTYFSNFAKEMYQLLVVYYMY